MIVLYMVLGRPILVPGFDCDSHATRSLARMQANMGMNPFACAGSNGRAMPVTFLSKHVTGSALLGIFLTKASIDPLKGSSAARAQGNSPRTRRMFRSHALKIRSVPESLLATHFGRVPKA